MMKHGFSNLKSVPLFDKNDKLLQIDDIWRLEFLKLRVVDNYTFSFDEAKTETEAFYKESSRSEYTGLKLKNGTLWQVGTKADSTSGASLSQKKDFIDFSKLEKELGKKR